MNLWTFKYFAYFPHCQLLQETIFSKGKFNRETSLRDIILF